MNVNTTTPDANAHGDHNEGNPAMTDATISTENTPPAQGETIALEPTDLMNAKILTALHGKDMRYSYEFGIWFIWDDKRFCPDKTGEAMRRAKTVTSDLLRRAGATDDTAMQKKLTKWALATQSERALKAMLELAKSEPGIAITADQLDRDKWLLNVANGTIDLKTGKRKPHDRADLITKLAPVSYDEHDDGTHCPEWVKFLDHMMPDTDRRAFLQRWLGYNLTGITTERAMAIFHGEGGGGKSTVIRLGAAMLGDYAMRTPTETLLTKREGGIPNDVARLRGARFVFRLGIG